MNPVIRLIRPKQWIKNTFVALPMFFGGGLLVTSNWPAACFTFLAFCFAASSIYCLNDIVDAEADRRHPVKCKRPIASGEISVRRAYLLMLLMAVLSACSVTLLPFNRLYVGSIVTAYWLLNIAYCTALKNYAIIDVCVVACGFVLRVLAGGYATNTPLTNWIVLMTFLLTLFLGFAKRRDDVIRMNLTGEPPRKNTIRYNLTFINQAITITAAITLVCYIMFTVSPEVTERFHSNHLYLTCIFVLIGLLRYIQIAVVDEKSGDPTKVILRDRFTQIVVLCWISAFLVIIYL